MTERRVRHREPGVEPWLRDDVQANRIASADWNENHPGICYEFGDRNSDPFIPDAVIEAVGNRREFAVALWQQQAITTVLVSRTPSEENKDGWCDVMQYEIKSRNPVFTSVTETEPNNVMPQLLAALCTPLGYPVTDENKVLFEHDDPILRVVIEFPDVIETARFPLDTSLAALGALAHKEYRDTIYGVPKV